MGRGKSWKDKVKNKVSWYWNGGPAEFEFIVGVNKYGNLDADDDIIRWLSQDEESSNSDIVIVSVVGDQGSGKTTLLNRIHNVLQEVTGKKSSNTGSVKVFPHKKYKARIRNGILLKTKPYSLPRGDGSVAKVYLVDIWTGPYEPLMNLGYTRLVDFCMAISSVVFFSTHKPIAQQSRSSIQQASPPYTYNLDSSILKFLPERIYEQAVFCLFRWPYESMPMNLEQSLQNQWRKDGPTGKDEFMSFCNPELPVTSKVIKPLIEASTRFNHNFYYKESQYESQFVLNTKLKKLMRCVFQPNQLLPVAGYKGRREVHNFEYLVKEVLLCINYNQFISSSPAFTTNYGENIRGPATSAASAKQNTNNHLASSSSAAKNRDDFWIANQHLLEAYYSSLANKVKESVKSCEILCLHEKMLEFHSAAAEDALVSYGTSFGKGTNEENLEPFLQCILEAFDSLVTKIAEVKFLIQQAITVVILNYQPNADSNEPMEILSNYEDLVRETISSFPKDFKPVIGDQSSAKIQGARAACLYIFEFKSLCRKILQKCCCLEQTELPDLFEEIDLMARQRTGYKPSYTDTVLEKFTEMSIQRLARSVQEEYNYRRCVETIVAHKAAEHARKVYRAKLEVASQNRIFGAEGLEHYHLDLQTHVLKAYRNSGLKTLGWNEHANVLEGQLKNDFKIHLHANLERSTEVPSQWKGLSKKVMEVFLNHVTAADLMQEPRSKRAYLEAQNEAMIVFQNVTICDPVVLVRFWESHLCDAMERSYYAKKEDEAVTDAHIVQSKEKVGIEVGRPSHLYDNGRGGTDVTPMDSSVSARTEGIHCDGLRSIQNNMESTEAALNTHVTHAPNHVASAALVTETGNEAVKLELQQLIEKMSAKIESCTSGPLKKKIQERLNSAKEVLRNEPASFVEIKKTLSQLQLWERKLK